MIEWVVQIVTGQDKRTNIRTERFPTKRECLAFLRATPHSFIRRSGRTYTIYPKGKG